MITKLTQPYLGAPSLAVDAQVVAPVAAHGGATEAAAYLAGLAKRVLFAINRAIFDADENCMRL